MSSSIQDSFVCFMCLASLKNWLVYKIYWACFASYFLLPINHGQGNSSYDLFQNKYSFGQRAPCLQLVIFRYFGHPKTIDAREAGNKQKPSGIFRNVGC